MRAITDINDRTAHSTGAVAWQGAATPRVVEFPRILRRVAVSKRALWRETAPPD